MILCFLITPTICLTQNSEHVKISIMHIPLQFVIPYDTISILTEEFKQDDNLLWWGFSNRDNNPMYFVPDVDSVKGFLNYLDTFAIIGFQNSWINILPIKNFNKSKPEQSVFYGDGWIHFHNGLLSSHCLISSNSHLLKKAFVLNTTLPTDNGFIDSPQFCYRSPELLQSHDTAGIFRSYYVFQENNDCVLIGNEPTFQAGFNNINSNSKPVSEVILGWISKKDIISWDHNLAWELNWHPFAVDERKENTKMNMPLLAFDDPKAAIQFCNDTSGTANFTTDEVNTFYLEANSFYDYRHNGTFVRYPLINGEKNKNYHFSDTSIFCCMTKDIGFLPSIDFVYDSSFLNSLVVYQKCTNHYPYFQNVFLIDEPSLLKLYKQLLQFSNAPGSSLRFEAVKALSAIMECLLGDNHEHTNQIALGEILFKLSFFQLKRNYWTWSVNKISDPAEGLTIQDLEQFRNDLTETTEVLKIILELSDVYPASIVVNSNENTRKLLWIPVDIFPHQKKNDEVTWRFF